MLSLPPRLHTSFLSHYQPRRGDCTITCLFLVLYKSVPLLDPDFRPGFRPQLYCPQQPHIPSTLNLRSLMSLPPQGFFEDLIQLLALSG